MVTNTAPGAPCVCARVEPGHNGKCTRCGHPTDAHHGDVCDGRQGEPIVINVIMRPAQTCAHTPVRIRLNTRYTRNAHYVCLHCGIRLR